MEHVEVLRHMKETIKAIMQSEVAALDAAIAALSAPQPEGEWVLVPRNPTEAMLDSAESAMIESECAYNAGEHDARSDAHGFPTMRIWQAVVGYRAMLAAAPQPPAEAQAVAWEWEYIGGDHYPRGHKVARSLREMDPTNPPYPETWRPTRPLIYGDTAPPSVSMGVEDGPIDASDNAEYIEYCADRLERCGLRVTADALRVIAQEHRALAQQPAAVDGAMLRDAERYRALVASGKFAPSFNSGWALATGTYRATKDELDAAADALAAQQGGSDNDR